MVSKGSFEKPVITIAHPKFATLNTESDDWKYNLALRCYMICCPDEMHFIIQPLIALANLHVWHFSAEG